MPSDLHPVSIPFPGQLGNGTSISPIAQKPDTIKFCELAIAASYLGYPVAVAFRDYPDALRVSVWRYLKEHFRQTDDSLPEEVSRLVDTQRALSALMPDIDKIRIVYVNNPRLVPQVAYRIAMDTPHQQKLSRPALICRAAETAIQDDCSTKIVVHAMDTEITALESWLTSTTVPGLFREKLASPNVDSYHPLVLRLLNGESVGSARGLQREQDRRLLRALLIGQAFLRNVKDQFLRELYVGLEDYEAVRKLVTGTVGRQSSEHYDSLSAAMVNRANVYLSCCEAKDIVRNVHDDGRHSVLTRTVEIGEVVDLGFHPSRKLQDLVAYLLRAKDGLKRFTNLGLITGGNGRLSHGWPSHNPKELVRLLRSWTPKQVRTRFQVLQSQGIVYRERLKPNGPFFYQLPEALTTRSSVFDQLPIASELRAHDPSG